MARHCVSQSAWTGGLLLVLAMAFCGPPAPAQPIDSFFDVFFEVDGDIGYDLSGNSGWVDPDSGDVWFEYENAPVEEQLPDGLPWWNEWYYDGNFDEGRWKEIHLEFDVYALEPGASLGWVVIDWTNGAWVGQGGPPTPDVPNAEDYIERSNNLIWDDTFIWSADQYVLPVYDPLNPQLGMHFAFDYVIPDYNPEWVSIDVQGQNIWITNGVLTHDCVPEPVSMLMLGGLGVGMAVARRATRKR